MKPQCESAADCLEHLARVMRMIGVDSQFKVLYSPYVKYDNRSWVSEELPTFSTPKDWEFAIAKLEDKPVFRDTKVYNKETGKSLFAGDLVLHGDYQSFFEDLFTLTPPKPKTLMVELDFEAALTITGHENAKIHFIDAGEIIIKNVQEALDKQK